MGSWDLNSLLQFLLEQHKSQEIFSSDVLKQFYKFSLIKIKRNVWKCNQNIISLLPLLELMEFDLLNCSHEVKSSSFFSHFL